MLARLDEQSKFMSQAKGFVEATLGDFQNSFDRMTVSIKDASSFFKKEMEGSSIVLTKGLEGWFNQNKKATLNSVVQENKRQRKFDTDMTRKKKSDSQKERREREKLIGEDRLRERREIKKDNKAEDKVRKRRQREDEVNRKKEQEEDKKNQKSAWNDLLDGIKTLGFSQAGMGINDVRDQLKDNVDTTYESLRKINNNLGPEAKKLALEVGNEVGKYMKSTFGNYKFSKPIIMESLNDIMASEGSNRLNKSEITELSKFSAVMKTMTGKDFEEDDYNKMILGLLSGTAKTQDLMESTMRMQAMKMKLGMSVDTMSATDKLIEMMPTLSAKSNGDSKLMKKMMDDYMTQQALTSNNFIDGFMDERIAETMRYKSLNEFLRDENLNGLVNYLGMNSNGLNGNEFYDLISSGNSAQATKRLADAIGTVMKNGDATVLQNLALQLQEGYGMEKSDTDLLFNAPWEEVGKNLDVIREADKNSILSMSAKDYSNLMSVSLADKIKNGISNNKFTGGIIDFFGDLDMSLSDIFFLGGSLVGLSKLLSGTAKAGWKIAEFAGLDKIILTAVNPLKDGFIKAVGTPGVGLMGYMQGVFGTATAGGTVLATLATIGITAGLIYAAIKLFKGYQDVESEKDKKDRDLYKNGTGVALPDDKYEAGSQKIKTAILEGKVATKFSDKEMEAILRGSGAWKSDFDGLTMTDIYKELGLKDVDRRYWEDNGKITQVSDKLKSYYDKAEASNRAKAGNGPSFSNAPVEKKKDIGTWLNQNTFGRIRDWYNKTFKGYAKGLDIVPYDNFPARLHKGESVLTMKEATMWRNLMGRSKFTRLGKLEAAERMGLIDGSHKAGLVDVPNDGYIAELHKGEAVLPAPLASAYRNAKNNALVRVNTSKNRAPSSIKGLDSSIYPGGLINPVPTSKLSNNFNLDSSKIRLHHGLDIFGKRGTPVYADINGTITKIGVNSVGGNRIGITDTYGFYHYFAHLNGYVKGMAKGLKVKQGQAIGYVGDSGNAKGTSPHLHYGVSWGDGADNTWLNPYPIIKNRSSLGDYQNFVPESVAGLNIYPYKDLVERYASLKKLDPNLVREVIRKESSFNPNAYNKKSKASGLMQILPLHFAKEGITNPFDPEQSIRAGTNILSNYTKPFKDIRVGLAAYNWGPGNVSKLLLKRNTKNWDDIKGAVPKETRDYVDTIMSRINGSYNYGDIVASSEDSVAKPIYDASLSKFQFEGDKAYLKDRDEKIKKGIGDNSDPTLGFKTIVEAIQWMTGRLEKDTEAVNNTTDNSKNYKITNNQTTSSSGKVGNATSGQSLFGRG